MKVKSPTQVALFSAIFSSLFVGLLSGILLESFVYEFWVVVVIIATSFAITYAVVFFLIERFLYGKIKLIYKNILNLKTQKEHDFRINMNQDVLRAVSDEVESWAEVKTKEIEQLKAQEEFRRDFLGNLAHELKTPIFSIQGYILTLLEGGMEDDKVNRDFLLRAAKGVERMTLIVDDLDMITKFESGNLPLDIQRHNIVDLAQEIVESVEYKASKRNVKITFKEQYDTFMVSMDRPRIGQVIANLINNAINYSKEEGGNIEIRFYTMEKNLLIEVADDGLGIAEEHLPRLFERFYRVDKSRSRNMGGTGLGLAIVKHIVEAHGQTINVRSTEGIGSTFSFTMERAR